MVHIFIECLTLGIQLSAEVTKRQDSYLYVLLSPLGKKISKQRDSMGALRRNILPVILSKIPFIVEFTNMRLFLTIFCGISFICYFTIKEIQTCESFSLFLI